MPNQKINLQIEHNRDCITFNLNESGDKYKQRRKYFKFSFYYEQQANKIEIETHHLNIVFHTDPPLDKIPAQSTPGEQVLQQHSKTAKTLLGEFDLNEAGKMVQKRRPATSILDEELLLSEDEADNPPPAKKAAVENEGKESKPSPANTADTLPQPEKAKKLMNTPQQQGNQLKRKKVMNRSPSNNRQQNNGPMNMNMNMNQPMNEPMGRDDLFMRKRNFMDSDMGFDRPGDRGFPSMGSNFLNDRNLNNSMNSNNFGNNRDFGDEFSRRPTKNDNFGNFGNRSGANGGGGAGGGGGGRMFQNRY